MIFAVHPVNTSAVAMISQLKEMLAAFFFMCSILWYLADLDSRKATSRQPSSTALALWRWRWYALSLLAFLLAILSKASVAMLPLVLLLIVWWRNTTITRWELMRVLPFFCIALVEVPLQSWVSIQHGQTYRTNFADQVAAAGTIPWFYLSKVLLPINLYSYPQWSVDPGDILWWLPLAGAILCTAVLAWYGLSPATPWGRSILFAWCFFGMALSPVLGFANISTMKDTRVSDQFQHIAMIGVIVLGAAGWSFWRLCSTHKAWTNILSGALVGLLALLTWQQSTLCGDPLLLFQYYAANNPESWAVQTNLGIALTRNGQVPEALLHFQKAKHLKPNFPESCSNLGTALVDAGKSAQAVGYFKSALQLRPDFHQARDGLATAFFNLANQAAQQGRADKAKQYFRQALAVNPSHANAHYNLALLLAKAGENQEALVHFEQAVRLKPDFPEAHNNLGDVLLSADRTDEAIEHFKQALALKPDLLEALTNLSNAYLQVGRPQDAIEPLRQILHAKPDDSASYAKLAKAYAASHRTQEAIDTAQQALALARAHNEAALAEQIQDWIAKYRGSLHDEQAGSH